MILRAPLLALALCALPATAQQSHAPTGIWGLQFGQPIAAQLPACHGYSPIQPQRCFRRGTVIREHADLETNPSLGFSARGTALLVGDNIEGLMVYFKHYERDKAAELLNARFGPPHESGEQSVVTGAGARLTGQVLKWNIDGLQVEFSDYVGNVNDGAFMITTPAYRDAQSRKATDSAQKYKGNL